MLSSTPISGPLYMLFTYSPVHRSDLSLEVTFMREAASDPAVWIHSISHAPHHGCTEYHLWTRGMLSQPFLVPLHLLV